ncbi:hypothetical protein [Effusibacillus pohliae]|uniref:hypothetical protein n=1 Tax=Effusibacillus pohliae TaxID=232270 RepID=UPI00036DE86B|nr:hypothetical protein [Effusibacillus pohliae]
MYYETFVKQFIDIMDERAPVTRVRNRVDMPLGSVQADTSTLIHTRLDLLDENSPFADIVISADGTECLVDYIAHIPANDRMTDEQFVQQVQQAGEVDSVSVLQSIDGRHKDTYVVTGRMRFDLADDDQNANSVTHDISETIVAILKAGGYDPAFADERETDDLVLWSPE